MKTHLNVFLFIFFMKNKIYSDKEWKNNINRLKSGVVLKDKYKIKSLLNKELLEAVKKRAPNKKFGILFSGGVDSSTIALICKNLNKNFICYSVGMKGSEDLKYAEEVAKKFGFKLKVKVMSLKDIEKRINELSKLFKEIDIVKIGVGLVTYSCMEMAKKDNIDVVFTGLGSEEIFAGYQRHIESKNINKECLNGLLEMNSRDNLRDIPIANYFGIKLETPYLDDNIIKLALKIPGRFKIDKYNKQILREVAYDLGLEDYAFRKKRAAQYGSSFDKAIKKIARENGFKYKSDYIKSLMKMNLGILFTGGKDSCLAMYKVKDNNIKCLISMDSENPDSYMFHTPNINLVKMQSKSLYISLIYDKTKGEKEKELKDLEKIIKKAKEKYELDGVVTGALFSVYQSSRIQKICDKLGLKCINPLWHMSQEEELKELIKNKFEVIITSIASEGLDKNWLGRKIDKNALDELIKLNKKFDINIAGEGGEYESFVLNMPLFNKKLKIIDSKINMENNNTGKLIIKKIKLEQ